MVFNYSHFARYSDLADILSFLLLIRFVEKTYSNIHLCIFVYAIIILRIISISFRSRVITSLDCWYEGNNVTKETIDASQRRFPRRKTSFRTIDLITVKGSNPGKVIVEEARRTMGSGR